MKLKQLLVISASLLLIASCGGTTTTATTQAPTSQVPTSEPTTVQPTTTVEPTSEITTVEPTSAPTSQEVKSIEIVSTLDSLFVTKTLQINVALQGIQENELVYTSSKDKIASVSETGLVTGLSSGKTTITVAYSKDDSISDTIDLKVNDTIMNIEEAGEGYDFTNLYQENASFKSNGIETYGFVPFRSSPAIAFYASATFNVTEAEQGDTWNRFSIGCMKTDAEYFHGVIFSPGPNFTAPKTVTMDINKKDVLWGAITDRSQVWNFNGLNTLDWSNVKVSLIRDEDNYYYFLNDQLYWVETRYTEFHDLDCKPVIMTKGLAVEVSNIEYTDKAKEVEKLISNLEANPQPRVYPTYANEVSVTMQEGKEVIEFLDASTTTHSNPKDYGAISKGDALSFDGVVSSKLEFDLSGFNGNGVDGAPALIVSTRYHDGNPNEGRGYYIGEHSCSFAGYNYTAELPGQWPAGDKQYIPDFMGLDSEETYHVVCYRTVLNGGHDLSMKIYDSNGTEIINCNHGWDGNQGNGPVQISFLSRSVSCKITNIQISVIE